MNLVRIIQPESRMMRICGLGCVHTERDNGQRRSDAVIGRHCVIAKACRTAISRASGEKFAQPRRRLTLEF